VPHVEGLSRQEAEIEQRERTDQIVLERLVGEREHRLEQLAALRRERVAVPRADHGRESVTCAVGEHEVDRRPRAVEHELVLHVPDHRVELALLRARRRRTHEAVRDRLDHAREVLDQRLCARARVRRRDESQDHAVDDRVHVLGGERAHLGACLVDRGRVDVCEEALGARGELGPGREGEDVLLHLADEPSSVSRDVSLRSGDASARAS
jgi:hypothetical protein